jgi:hypothetical protein
MNWKSSLIAWCLIPAFFSALSLFTSAGISLAQPDLCSGYARQYADRYANPSRDVSNSFPGKTACTPCGEAPSNKYWSLLYDYAYNSCAWNGVVH